MKKRFLTALPALALCAGLMLPAAHAADAGKLLSVTAHQTADETYLQVAADGTDLPFSALDGYGQPFVDENGRTQIPLRKFAETVGGTVDWDSEAQQVTVTLREDTISLVIGRQVLTKNGSEMEMDTAARIIDGSTYIPLRAAAEALGYTVEYRQRNAALAALRLDRENIVSADFSASIVGASAPHVVLDGQQMDRLCELLNQACMTSENEDFDFFQDTVLSYAGSGTITLKDGSEVILFCRGENGVRYSILTADGQYGDSFLLISPQLHSFLMDIMYGGTN